MLENGLGQFWQYTDNIWYLGPSIFQIPPIPVPSMSLLDTGPCCTQKQSNLFSPSVHKFAKILWEVRFLEVGWGCGWWTEQIVLISIFSLNLFFHFQIFFGKSTILYKNLQNCVCVCWFCFCVFFLKIFLFCLLSEIYLVFYGVVGFFLPYL